MTTTRPHAPAIPVQSVLNHYTPGTLTLCFQTVRLGGTDIALCSGQEVVDELIGNYHGDAN